MIKKHSHSVLCTALLGTWLTFSPLAVASEQDNYIPADTLFYMGTGAPLPVEHLFALMPDFAKLREDDEPSRLDGLSGYLKDPASKLAAWGIEGEVAFSAYTVGVSPVLRVSLSDTEKFLQELNNYERKRELGSDERQQDGWTIKLYSFDSLRGRDTPTSDEQSAENPSPALDDTAIDAAADANEAADANAAADDTATNTAAAKEISVNGSTNNPVSSATATATDATNTADGSEASEGETSDDAPQLTLVVGVSDKDVVFGMVANTADDALIESVLGISKPETSIEADGKLKELRKQWGYGDELASFIDFEQIAAVLTDASNPVARQLQDAGLLTPRMLGYLEQMRSEPCRTEVTQLVSNWPRTVAGYRQFDISDKQVEFNSHAAVVIAHEKLRETLKLFRGLLPSSQSSNEPMLSLGLGLTVDNLAQALGQLNEMAATVRYQCQALYPLNSLAASDLSAVSMGVVMFGGMARGVRGMSVNIFDADVDPAAGVSAVKAIDTAIAVSADDPAMLLGTLKMLPQFGAVGDLPVDGSEVDVTHAFPLPLPEGTEIKAAMKGNNIVLYSGEKSTDFANRLAQNETEGFLRGTANTKLILEKLTSSLANVGDEKNREQITGILDRYLQGELMYSLEFTDNGIEIVSKGLIDRRDAAAAE
jgi:hypothetical protein